MNRQERRRQSRAHAKKQPVIIAGDGIVASELEGSQFEAQPHQREPEKIAGKHRWIATVAYNLTDEEAAGWSEKSVIKRLDNSRLMYMAIGCFDCERTIVEVGAGSRCPAPAS